MSIFKKSMMAVIAMTVAVSSANANENFKPYVGLDLSGHEYKLDGLNDDYDAVALGGRIGADLHENFGVEGRFGFGIVDDKVEGVAADVSINHYLGAFGKVQTNSYNGFRAYGLAGIAYVELEASGPAIVGGSITDDDTSFAWGVGASYAFNNNWGANLEYVSLNQDADAQGLNLGLTYHF